MNKRIRRLSFGLAMLICLHGLGMGMAENTMQDEPQPTVQQEEKANVPASEPEPEKRSAPEKEQKTDIKETEMLTAASTKKPEEQQSDNETAEKVMPTPNVKATTDPTVEPITETTTEPTVEPTTETTTEPTVEPTTETTTEPTVEPTAETTTEPTAEPTAEVTIEPAVELTTEPVLETTPEPAQIQQDTTVPVLHRFDCTPVADGVQKTKFCFTAEYSDNVSLIKVRIYVDEVLTAESDYCTAPEECIAFTYKTANLSEGEHWLYVEGIDAAGNGTCSERMSITVTLGTEESPEMIPNVSDKCICGIPAHLHSADCYDEAGNRICNLDEHTHGENCLSGKMALSDEEDQVAEDIPTGDEISVAPRIDLNLWKGVKPSDERGMAIPMLFQGDYPQTICTIRGIDRSVASSGCGATSLSMVIAYLTGNTEQNPYKLFCEAVDAGRYFGAGWSHDTLSYYAAAYGISNRWISNDENAILEALKAGKPVIAHMGPGIFTSRGHYLVLRGVTEDGLILMNDPNSRNNCERAFPVETLLKQAKTAAAFMICWTEVREERETSQQQAQETTLVLNGDINGSGRLDINDVQLLYEMLNLGEIDSKFDFNGDGTVDNLDIDLLVEAVLNPNIEDEIVMEEKTNPNGEVQINLDGEITADEEMDTQSEIKDEGSVII